MKNIEQSITKNDIRYGIKMKYKELANMFNLEYNTGGSRALQLRQLQRLYDINLNKTLYVVVREYSEEEKEDLQAKPTPSNFKILKKDKNKGGVYKIQLGNIIYIGQTNNFANRYNAHVNGQNQCDTKSLLLNGGTFELLEFEENQEDRFFKENKYIKEYEELGYKLLNSKDVLYYGKNKKIKENAKNCCSITFNKSDLDKITKLLSDNNIDFKQHKFRDKKQPNQ